MNKNEVEAYKERLNKRQKFAQGDGASLSAGEVCVTRSGSINNFGHYH